MGSEFNTFLGLPELARTKIYEKTLGVPHPVYLYLGPGSSVQTFAPDAPSQWLALLRTNRRVSAEASEVFYRVNHFELLDINRPQITVLQPFLDHIGPANAASISYLCVSFPTMVDTDIPPHPPPPGGEGEEVGGGMELSGEDLQVLELLESKCSSLETLETVVHHRNARLFTKPDQVQQDAFTQIDRRLRAIPSLRRIIVRVDYPGAVQTSSAREMQRLGWLVPTGVGTSF